MYRVVLEQISTFKQFLEIVDKEYIDVVCKEDCVQFVIDSPEIFCIHTLGAEVDGYEKDFSFRINRYLLHRLSIEGFISFDFTDTEVKVSFINKAGKLVYSFNSLLQSGYDNEYTQKFQMLESLDKSKEVEVDISELKTINQITRIMPAIIHVNNGLAGIVFNTGLRVYKKLACKGEFSVSSKALATILKFSDRVYSIGGFLCIKYARIWMCVTKCNAVTHDEFVYIEEQKSAFICDIDFSNVCNLYSQIDIKSPFVNLSMSTKCVTLDYHNSKFTVPFDVTNVQCAPGFEIGDVSLPSDLITKIFQKAGQFQFKFYKKRTFNQLESRDLIIIFR